jgi:hypothetical protein
MTDRRDFLAAAGAAVILPAILREAGSVVRRGRLGTVNFCRVSNPALLPAAQLLVGKAAPGCVFEVDPAADGAALLGTLATLVVNRGGCRLFAGQS